VSTATVSLALVDHASVAEATKARVREVAAELGYRTNAVGRALRLGRTNAIGVVIPHSGEHVFSHAYYMELLAGISDALNSADMTLVLSTAATEGDEEAAYVKIVRSRIVDGVVLASAALHDEHIARLKLAPHPFVFVGRYPIDPSVHAVGVDDVGGARAATQHLLQHGHTRIAHISGPEGHLSAMDRREGYHMALRAAGIEPSPTYVYEGDYSEEAGRSGMRALLAVSDPPTALFAANDETAVGAMAMLRAVGKEPGPGFPVVGFDDLHIASLVTPSLTTVRQPMRRLGAEAIHVLMDLLRGESPESVQRELPTELVVRQSCGCRAASQGEEET
jgi:DNA-binding LacI/PurR family transcriptional regulator